jgi:hypothetical protein
MDKKMVWLITMLLSFSPAFAEGTSTITVGPSATVNIDSNGNSVSASAGMVIIKQGGKGTTHIKVKTTNDGHTKTSVKAIIINGEEGDINVETQVINKDDLSVSNVVIEGDEQNVQIHSTDNTTTIIIR